ncbi:G patch domain-containing protein 4 [Euwallacea fornicatus]|uniref:G patch domain-containing protein 4 n=1 Tax=Euwallacea fornicatus TaxID=995702 RepID=UPI0033901558
MNFAKKQLEKYGWTEGKGLGRNEDGISKAIKPKLKFDNFGLGHDIGAEFTNNWWERVYNTTANNLKIKVEGDGVKMSFKDSVEITTKPYSTLALKKDVNLEYGSFVKTSKLTAQGTQTYSVPILETEPLKPYRGLTDEELFAACGGRTCHKGSRHGIYQRGKLSRLEKQEKLLLRKMKKVSLHDEGCSKAEKKLCKLKKQKESCEEKFTPLPECDSVPQSSSSLKKKHKKRKSVSFNETVTKIYTADPEANFDSEVGSLRDENSNDANNANSGSDEGIEQDLENNNDLDLDNQRVFEEARLNFHDLSKAERKKLKKKRKFENKLTPEIETALKPHASGNEVMQEDKESGSKKRKYREDHEELNSKRNPRESPERLKRKRNKKKKHKQKKEEAKMISSISKSLEGFCRISESE